MAQNDTPRDRLRPLAVAGALALLGASLLAYAVDDGFRGQCQRVVNRAAAAVEYACGTAYERGTLVQGDAARAARWYLRAAQRGDADAQLRLAALYEAGHGLARDAALAALWYRAAALQGNVAAQLSLGHLYQRGDGVAADGAQAQYWLERAARNPSSDSGTAGGGALPLPAAATPFAATPYATTPLADGDEPGVQDGAPLPAPDMNGIAEAAAINADEQSAEDFRQNEQAQAEARRHAAESADEARELDRQRIDAEDRAREENGAMLEQQREDYTPPAPDYSPPAYTPPEPEPAPAPAPEYNSGSSSE